jgi:general secretion pathway protein J
VEYALDRDPEGEGGEALFRREKLRLDGQPEDDGRRDLVAHGVKRLTLSYWDPKKKEWVREWDTTRTERSNELPTLVRAEMELTLADGRLERLSCSARVALTRPLDY